MKAVIMRKIFLVLALALILISSTKSFANSSKFGFLANMNQSPYSLGNLYSLNQSIVDTQTYKYIDNDNLRLKSSQYLDCSNIGINEMMQASMVMGSMDYLLTQGEVSESTSLIRLESDSLKLKSLNAAAFYALVPGFFVHGAGHFYGGDSRTGSLLLSTEVLGFIFLLGYPGWAVEELFGDMPEFMRSAYFSLGIATVLFFGSWYYDIFHSPQAVKDYNEKLQMKNRVGLKINPSGINIVFEFK
jgi:hypothetical protein